MQYYLTALSGPYKGRLWAIDEPGLSLGRDASCDICLMDPVVSRHQCRVLVREDLVFLEDTGGRNPALVNGAVATDAALKPGDTIALGGSLFLVSAAADSAALPGAAPLDATARWDKDSPVLLNLEEARQQVDLRPNSLFDLVYLYDLTRVLGRCASRDAFLEVLEGQVRERFRPRDDRMVFPYDAQAETTAPGSVPNDIARECLAQGQGILRPGMVEGKDGKQRNFTMAAPLVAGDLCLGALAVQTHTPLGVYDEDDLKLLVLLAGAAAPILYALEHQDQLASDNARLRALLGESDTLVGGSRKMGHLRGVLRKAAKTNLNVLILGETGTGKELAARTIHALSGRHGAPFVVVNCAAIPRDLFESELFGYKKGAFTGADQDKPGLLSLAHGGTLFLDEVGDLSLENQARILRVVEQGAFRPIGGGDEVCASLRIVAATNKDLDRSLAEGTFRDDLYHRLSGCQITMPRLDDHPEDIPELVLHFIDLARRGCTHGVSGVSPEAIDALKGRPWPGNVRELRNCVLRALMSSRGPILQERDFPDQGLSFGITPDTAAVTLSLVELEKRHIKAVIDQCRGNLKAAAEVLGIARSTLYNKISEYGIG